MKKLANFLVKSCAFVLFSFWSFAIANSPFEKPKTERYRVDFLSSPQWVEITNIDETPVQLKLELVNDRQKTIKVAVFFQDGEADPEVVSIFKDKVNLRSTLFAIVKWHYYLPGASTEGDYYEVHAYGIPDGQNKFTEIVENKLVTNLFGSGFEG